MEAQAQYDIIVHLLCHHMPGAVFGDQHALRVGLQRADEVVDDVPGDAPAAEFKIPLRVKKDARNGKPSFLGPFAQGKPEERFVYLCWGERSGGGHWETFRRAKIHLQPLTWEVIRRSQESGEPVRARLDMTDPKGGPVCASVKPGQIEWEV